MKHRLRFVLLLILMGLLISACDSSNKEADKVKNEGFAIYLLAEDIPAQQVFKTNLDELQLRTEPLISVDDIIAYHKETQELELIDGAMIHLYARSHGQPFVVCVGLDRIYCGVFWDGLKSTLWAPIMIDLPLSPESRSTRIWALTSEGNELISDPRILESLEQAGKLK